MKRLPLLLPSIRRKAIAPVVLCAVAALSACSSTQDVLEPSALLANDAANPLPQAQFPMATPETGQTATQPQTQVAAINSNARVRFAPVVGASGDAATPLASRISARATARGIRLAGADDSSATHIMKGYFSAISEAGETTVIYVWDVLDPAGNRVHRIQGQSKAQTTTQGWPGVPQQTMEAIADQTVEQLASWLVTRPG